MQLCSKCMLVRKTAHLLVLLCFVDWKFSRPFFNCQKHSCSRIWCIIFFWSIWFFEQILLNALFFSGNSEHALFLNYPNFRCQPTKNQTHLWADHTFFGIRPFWCFLKIISVLSFVTQHNYIFQIKTLIMGFHQLQSIKVRSANNSKSGRVCDVIF